jgi:hypothetical protein
VRTLVRFLGTRTGRREQGSECHRQAKTEDGPGDEHYEEHAAIDVEGVAVRRCFLHDVHQEGDGETKA